MVVHLFWNYLESAVVKHVIRGIARLEYPSALFFLLKAAEGAKSEAPAHNEVRFIGHNCWYNQIVGKGQICYSKTA